MNTNESEHDWFNEQIATYLAGGLSPQQRERFDSHAAQCTSCADELYQSRQMEQQMSDLFQAAIPSEDFEDRIISRLRLSAAAHRRWIHPIIRNVATAAAAAIIIGGVGFVGQQYLETGKLPTLATILPTRTISQNEGAVSVEGWDFGGGINNSLNWSDKESVEKKIKNNRGEFDGDFDVKDRLRVAQKSQATSIGNENRFGATNDASHFKPNDFGISNLSLHGTNTFTGGTSVSAGGLIPGTQFAVNGGDIQAINGPVDMPAQQVNQAVTGKDDLLPQAQQAAPTSQPAERKVIREGEIEFEVTSYDDTFTKISSITREEGGFVMAADSDKLPNGKVKGSVTVRVPPDHLDTLVLKLRALGDLKSEKIGSRDISKDYTDLQSELRAAQAMQERLLDLIKNSKGKVSEMLDAEKELGNWRTQIEKIQGEINYYNNLVDMATLTITAYEKDIKTPASATQTEQIDTGIETDDVETARNEAIKKIDEMKGRIVESSLQQFEAGQLAAKIVADVPPENAGQVIDRLKQLGTVARLEVHRQETSDPAKPQAATRVETTPTRITISLYNLANVAPRLTTNLNLAGEDVEKVYRAILSRVEKSGGRVLSSNLNQQDATNVVGSLQFEVKSADADAVVNDIRAASQVLKMNVTENPDTQNVTTAKQAFTVQIIPASQVPPREMLAMGVETSQVDSAVQNVTSAVTTGGGRIVESSMSQDPSGKSVAKLTIDVPLDKVDAIVDLAKQQGKIRGSESSKDAQVPEGPLSHARITLTLGTGETIVSGEHGFFDSIRGGLSTSVKGLLWSLRLIVIGLCLVGPWVLLIWGGFKLARRKRNLT